MLSDQRQQYRLCHYRGCLRCDGRQICTNVTEWSVSYYPDCKKLAYTTLVRSGMEYASIIWNPYTVHQVRFRQVGENSAVCSQVDPLLLFVEDQCHHFTSAASAGIVSRETPDSEIGLHVQDLERSGCSTARLCRPGVVFQTKPWHQR